MPKSVKSHQTLKPYTMGEYDHPDDKFNKAHEKYKSITPLSERDLRVLDELVVKHLFVNPQWPPKDDDIVALRKVFERFKLIEPTEFGKSIEFGNRNTLLGDFHNVDLLRAFTGVFDDDGIYTTLFQYELMDLDENDLWGDVRDDEKLQPLQVRIMVREAYFKFYNRRPRQTSRFPLVMHAFAADHQRQLDQTESSAVRIARSSTGTNDAKRSPRFP